MRSVANELGSEPPAAVAALRDADQQRLAELLATARRRQAQALEQAIDDGLSFLPRMARVAVRRLLK